MKIFILNQAANIQKMADAIAKKFPSNNTEVRWFTKEESNCFNTIPVHEFSQTFWIGCSEASQIGDFDADAFVNKFHTEFVTHYPEAKQKEFVNHLYLLGRETAQQQGDNESLAQCIANKLFANGFKKVLVHAIANPPGDDISMNLEIIIDSGAARRVPFYQVGDLHGYLLSRKADSMLQEIEKSIRLMEEKLNQTRAYRSQEGYTLRKELKAAHDEKASIINQATTFLEASNLLAELDRPHNTFTPNHPERRPMKNVEQEKAIVKIEQHIRLVSNLTYNKNKKLRRFIELNVRLRNETGDWSVPIHETMKSFGHFLGRYSHHYYVLKELYHVACLENKKEKQERKIEKPSKRIKNKMIASVAKGKKKEKPVMPEQMHQALEQIKQFSAQLRQEYSCKRKWLRFFCPATKDYKATQLEKLAFDIEQEFKNNPIRPQWIIRVQAATLDDRLTQSIFSRRTKNLLTNIIKNQAEHGINDPARFGKKTTPSPMLLS